MTQTLIRDVEKRLVRPHKPYKQRRPKHAIHTGQQFGLWTALTGVYLDRSKSKAYIVACRCVCGAEKEIPATHLVNGQSTMCKVCGCGTPDADLTGRQYRNWTVISRIPIAERKDRNQCWLCRCACGNEKAMAIQEMKRSRGCLECSLKRGSVLRGRPYGNAYSHMAHNAKQKTRECSVSYEEFIEQVLTGMCHYCHVPLEWIAYVKTVKNKRTGKLGSTSPYMMDRKDSCLGYVSGNIVACCQRCNYAKRHDFTYEEWYEMTACLRAKNDKGAACAAATY